MNKFLLLFLAFSVLPQAIFSQCEPQVLDCNALVESCDLSPNNPQYWNEIYWWDQVIQTHDLAEAKIDLSLRVKDTCIGAGLAVRCLLFLDLDGDGTKETLIDSDSLTLNANQVPFNNLVFPGGTPRNFDERPVPGNQKWRFVLNSSISGDTSNIRLLWTNYANPGVFELPELPHGSHKVRWIVTNSAGASKTCEKSFVVKDCKAPTVVCLNGLSVNIMQTQMIQLWASDFLQYTEDNVTPTGQIRLGIRKSGTGVGFPVENGNPVQSVIFNCDELGTQLVELWAIDAAGNADYCETNVIIDDYLENCGMPPALIEACVTPFCENWIGLDETYFDFSVSSIFFPPFTSYFDLGSCGSIQISAMPAEVTITPTNDGNPLNGITPLDIVKLQQFINGTSTFSSPYQWIAADANHDNVVDTLDVLECKNLILGNYTQLPNNTSWRFVDKNYVFPTPNPLSSPLPESITVNSTNLPTLTPEFIAIKICALACAGLVGFYDLEPENKHLIGTPEPNPTHEGAMIPLQLLEKERVLLEVIDFSGRLVFRSEMSLPEGRALLEIPATVLAQAGVYVWRIKAGEMRKSGKIVRY